MLLISFLPMCLVALQGYHCARQAVVANVHLHLFSLLEGRRTLLNEWLRERTNEIERLASLPGMSERVAAASRQEESEAALAPLLDWVQASSDSYECLILYDQDWNRLAETSQRTHHDDDFLTDVFRSQLAAAQGVFFDVAHSYEENRIGLHIGCALRDASEKTLGFIVANLNLSMSLNPLLQERSGMWRTGKVYVASRELFILTEPFGPENSGQVARKTTPEALAFASAAPLMVHEYKDFLGHRVLGTAITLPMKDWILVAEVDTREALEWLDILLIRVLCTVSVVLVLVVLISILSSRFLGKPFKELARVSHSIRAGRIEERLGPMSGTEAETVRLAFNLMLDELREKQKEIVRTATLASIGELSASIVHEMRNPLSSIRMNLQALSTSVQESESDYELAEIASQQVNRVDNMLTDLLQYGRPVEMRRRPILFAELSDAALDVVEELAKAKDVAIVVENGLDTEPIRIDKEQMCRAVSNLLLNAIHASSAGSEIQLTAARQYTNDHIEIRVLDAGTGLSDEALLNAFKPFYSTKPDGTGLGLANVKKIVELHDGTVSAENRAGGGAAFVITLPMRAARSS